MKLYQHQIDALEKTKNTKRCAYYHDMGLGKTFTGAEKMAQLGSKINLIVCQKSKIQDWVAHFKQNYSDFLVLNLTNKSELKMFEIESQRVVHAVVGIINYELAWRRKCLLKLKNFTLMLDESSLIQNRKAKQSKFVLKMQPENVILLSGTPTAGKYENLWTQMHLLGWQISEQLYNRHYVNWKILQVPCDQCVKVVDKLNPYKNVERLKEKMREHGAVFLKTEECFDLPKQNFIEINVPPTKDYKYFMKNSIVMLTDGETLLGDTSLTKRIYARQLCGQYCKEKFEAFKELLEATNDRLIVFYNFNNELNQLAHICEILSRPVSVINGHEKDLTAYEKEKNSVTLVQYQAGAMGLNLQKANKIIYFSPPERSELFEQSKKRVHRINQDKPCFYYKLICKNSIENDIYDALSVRKDYTNELFKKRYDCSR